MDQDEESGLEGIFRLMFITYDGQADAPDHRFVPLDQCREGQLGHLIRSGREPFQELAVGQAPDGPDVVKSLELTKGGPAPLSGYHGVCPQPASRLFLADPVSVVSL